MKFAGVGEHQSNVTMVTIREDVRVLHADDIWRVIRHSMRPGVWLDITDIHKLVAEHVELDAEDLMPAGPGHSDVRWRRNVRNVLQQRKQSGELEWERPRRYRLVE